MQPSQLQAGNFSHYPPQGAALAVQYLPAFRKMSLGLLPIILRQVIDYDWRFPAEQRALREQLEYLQGLTPTAFAKLMGPFEGLQLPAKLSGVDWVSQPQYFMEQFSATLWSTLQMDYYRGAALAYEQALSPVLAGKAPEIPRFTIVVVGKGVAQSNLELFRPLRPYGVFLTGIRPDGGLPMLLNFIKERAKRHPQIYAHWYIDGGQPEQDCGPDQGITLTSYAGIASAAVRELQLTSRFMQRSPVGPEELQSYMAALGPKDLGLKEGPTDAALRHFEANLLTQDAGTQIFSTTFVQWAARESIKRAQPSTMLARFAPRQQMAPINELLNRDPRTQAIDPEGSLIDADMAAYYTWINQRRLPGADQARFLVWFEGHSVALAIAPGLPPGTTSSRPASLQNTLDWMN